MDQKGDLNGVVEAISLVSQTRGKDVCIKNLNSLYDSGRLVTN